jgi:hypothetical protein
MFGLAPFPRLHRILAAGPLILLVALAPSVLSIEHLAAYAGLVHEADEMSEAHVDHCHVNMASCGDQPLPPNPGGAPAVVDVVEPELRLVGAPEDTHLRRDGNVIAPPTEPPRTSSVRHAMSL